MACHNDVTLVLQYRGLGASAEGDTSSAGGGDERQGQSGACTSPGCCAGPETAAGSRATEKRTFFWLCLFVLVSLCLLCSVSVSWWRRTRRSTRSSACSRSRRHVCACLGHNSFRCWPLRLFASFCETCFRMKGGVVFRCNFVCCQLSRFLFLLFVTVSDLRCDLVFAASAPEAPAMGTAVFSLFVFPSLHSAQHHNTRTHRCAPRPSDGFRCCT